MIILSNISRNDKGFPVFILFSLSSSNIFHLCRRVPDTRQTLKKEGKNIDDAICPLLNIKDTRMNPPSTWILYQFSWYNETLFFGYDFWWWWCSVEYYTGIIWLWLWLWRGGWLWFWRWCQKRLVLFMMVITWSFLLLSHFLFFSTRESEWRKP